MEPSEVAYLTHAMGWSILGWVVGYVMGRIGREVHVREVTVSDALPPMRRRGDKRTAMFGTVIAGLAALTLILNAVSLVRLEGLVRCQASYAEQAAEATAARVAAAEEDRAALNRLTSGIARAVTEFPDPEVRREQTRAALEAYNAAVAEADAQREAQPYPDPPSEVCR